MEYMILSEDSTNALETEVNECIRIGYVPLGGISVTLHESADTFIVCQAMTREFDIKKDFDTK